MSISNSNHKWLALTYPWIIWIIAAGFFFYKYLIQVSPSVMTNDSCDSAWNYECF